MFPHPVHAQVHTAHQNIRRTAGLVDCQIIPKPLPVDPIPIKMNERRLCKRWQRLMKAVDHHICSRCHRILRKLFRKWKMRPMRFIHDQRNAFFVSDFCDFSHIRHHTVISRRSDHHCLDRRILLKHLFHICRVNGSIYPQIPRRLWIKIFDIKIPQHHTVISRFMTVSCQQDRSSPAYTAADGRQYSAGTSIYQIMRLL